eukprot:3196797-Pleurochrysis_carterae.AAC.1
MSFSIRRERSCCPLSDRAELSVLPLLRPGCRRLHCAGPFRSAKLAVLHACSEPSDDLWLSRGFVPASSLSPSVSRASVSRAFAQLRADASVSRLSLIHACSNLLATPLSSSVLRVVVHS